MIEMSVYVQKLVSHIKGRTQAKGIWIQDAETTADHKMVAETGGWR